MLILEQVEQVFSFQKKKKKEPKRGTRPKRRHFKFVGS
jgi:hypothetical protein